jgi:hypothetical protein
MSAAKLEGNALITLTIAANMATMRIISPLTNEQMRVKNVQSPSASFKPTQSPLLSSHASRGRT